MVITRVGWVRPPTASWGMGSRRSGTARLVGASHDSEAMSRSAGAAAYWPTCIKERFRCRGSEKGLL